MSKRMGRIIGAVRYVAGIPGGLYRRFRKLNPWGKAFVCFLIIFYTALASFIIIITPARIAQFLYDFARTRITNKRFGWLVLGAVIAAASFPPLIGHTTLITLCGFAYGMKGFLLAAPASSLGSAIVFIFTRLLFSSMLKRWSASNTQWKALETVIRAKGLPLIILIRASPMPPWVYSNILFPSIESVSLWQFVIATFFVYPKILLHVFIGSRAAALSDGDQRKDMDIPTKIFNGVSIAVGIMLGIAAGWFIYYSMKKQIRETEDVSPEVDALAEEAIDSIDEGAPLLRDFQSDDCDPKSQAARDIV